MTKRNIMIIAVSIFILYLGWIFLSLADVSGNFFGVNDGKIDTYLSVTNKTGYGAEKNVRYFEVSGNYTLAMQLIENDFKALNEYEAKFKKYGVEDRPDIKAKLLLAKMQVESSRLEINSIIIKNMYPGLNNFELQEKTRELEKQGVIEPYRSFILES